MADREPVSKGFGVGLYIWLLFLISFYMLGYEALFSIGLGGLGGLVSGFIVDWWLTKEERTEPAKKPADDPIAEVAVTRRGQRRNSALGRARRRRQPQQQQNRDWQFWRNRGQTDSEEDSR